MEVAWVCRDLKFSLELSSLSQNRKRIWTIEHEGMSSQCTLPIYIIDICQSRSGPGKQFCYIYSLFRGSSLWGAWELKGARFKAQLHGCGSWVWMSVCENVQYIIVKTWISPFRINKIFLPSFSSSLRFPYHTFLAKGTDLLLVCINNSINLLVLI